MSTKPQLLHGVLELFGRPVGQNFGFMPACASVDHVEDGVVSPETYVYFYTLIELVRDVYRYLIGLSRSLPCSAYLT